MLRATIPSDDVSVELFLTSLNILVGVPQPGIAVVSTNTTQNSLSSYDYEISLSIQNVSLLYDVPIFCHGGTPAGQVMASCSLIGEYECHFASGMHVGVYIIINNETRYKCIGVMYKN